MKTYGQRNHGHPVRSRSSSWLAAAVAASVVATLALNAWLSMR